MKKYVVAMWSDHTGELLQELIEANSAFEAVLSYMQWDAEEYNLKTMEDVYKLAANMDAMVNVLDISKRFGTNKPGPVGQLPLHYN